jgi:hypothetical protein
MQISKKGLVVCGAKLSTVEDDEGLVETDLDMPLLSWLEVKVMVPQEGKVSPAREGVTLLAQVG